MSIDNEQNHKKLMTKVNDLEAQLKIARDYQTVFEAEKELFNSLMGMLPSLQTTGFPAKGKLLDNWIAIAESAENAKVLQLTLHQTMKIATEALKADSSSLFIFNHQQKICYSVNLSNACQLTATQNPDNISLDDGLVAWMKKNQTVALIKDTQNDERWYNIPPQSSSINSVLSVPLCTEKELLGIITLYHHEVDYFQSEMVQLIELTAQTITFIIEIAAVKIEKATSEIQKKLLENLVEVARSPIKKNLLKQTISQILDLAVDITHAEKGSMFLLERRGEKVVDAILSRPELPPDVRAKLIGTVFKEGFAGWIIRNQEAGLILDIENDCRWTKLANDNTNTRSAIGVPIKRGDYILGVIILEHFEVNHFSEETLSLMQVTADQMALVIENAYLYYEVQQYASTLDEELQKGREMQRDFLPTTIIQPKNWEIEAFLNPAKELSGDFYDIFPIGNYVGLVIADVCDKGVGSAMFMALMRSLLRIFAQKIQPTKFDDNYSKPTDFIAIGGQEIDLAQIIPLEAIKLTNNYVANNHGNTNMFATIFFGVLNPHNGVLTYINGGHEPVLILNQFGIKKKLDSTGAAVGMMSHMKFTIEQTILEKGDILFGYTDGVTDGKNPEGKLFGKKKLLELIQKKPFNSAADLLNTVKNSLLAYIDDAPQFDDITLLSVRRKTDNIAK
jgi:phosphoserine phosphatase RsbU/P